MQINHTNNQRTNNSPSFGVMLPTKRVIELVSGEDFSRDSFRAIDTIVEQLAERQPRNNFDFLDLKSKCIKLIVGLNETWAKIAEDARVFFSKESPRKTIDQKDIWVSQWLQKIGTAEVDIPTLSSLKQSPASAIDKSLPPRFRPKPRRDEW